MSFYTESKLKSALHVASTVLVLTIVIFEISRLFGGQEKDAFLRTVGNVSAQAPVFTVSLDQHPLMPQASANVCIFPAKLSLSCLPLPVSIKYCASLLSGLY